MLKKFILADYAEVALKLQDSSMVGKVVWISGFSGSRVRLSKWGYIALGILVFCSLLNSCGGCCQKTMRRSRKLSKDGSKE